jgi:hypothetical protein
MAVIFSLSLHAEESELEPLVTAYEYLGGFCTLHLRALKSISEMKTK